MKLADMLLPLAGFWATSLVILAIASQAQGEVTDIKADISAEVTELIEGETGSGDLSTESFDGTSPILPIQAFAGLGGYDLSDTAADASTSNGARAITDFDDPTISSTANPMEFGLEADCFSQVARTSYLVTSEADEYRDLVFSAADLDVTSTGMSNEVISNVFFEGAVLIWADDTVTDLSGMTVAFDFDVTRSSTGGNSESDATNANEQVFDAHVAITGQGSTLTADHSSNLSLYVGGPELLLSLGGQDAIVAAEELEDIGTVYLMILPQQTVQYTFQASADEALRLSAHAECVVRNLPGGTGIGAVFGRSFLALADVVQSHAKVTSGKRIERAINEAIGEPEIFEQQAASVPLCGTLGIETPAVGLLGFCSFIGRRRWGL